MGQKLIGAHSGKPRQLDMCPDVFFCGGGVQLYVFIFIKKRAYYARSLAKFSGGSHA